ncbi:MAG: hypothetical protein ACRDLZ_04695, partial [Gaiellaceae bacterium]
VVAAGGLDVRMQCDGSSRVRVFPAAGAGWATMAGMLPAPISGVIADAPWQASGGVNGTGGLGILTSSGIGRTVVSGPLGVVTTFEFAYYEIPNGFGTTNDCFLRGILSTTNP